MGEREFTVEEARELLAELRPAIDELIVRRADLAEASAAQRAGEEGVALADLKADEARVSEIVDRISAHGVQVKGVAPLLLDFPMQHAGRQVLLCWVEGESQLEWYHDTALGFAGRRPIAELSD